MANKTICFPVRLLGIQLKLSSDCAVNIMELKAIQYPAMNKDI